MENFKKRCVLEALIAEREGMIAENKQREYLQQAMAYSDNSFFILADNIRTICKEAPGRMTIESRHELFQRRLKELGLFDKDSDYDGLVGKWVEELSAVFRDQGHSGCSADITLAVFNQLMKEWEAHDED